MFLCKNKRAMNKDLVLNFKITNWCNLNCAHCCERSGANEAPNFISLEKMEKYFAESRKMSIRPNELVTFGGGESMAPYLHGDMKYIPSVLNVAYVYGYVPTFKTNGTWGDNDFLRKRILSDIAVCAYRGGKLVTLDISVDEFHHNHDGIVKIIRDVLCNPDLCYAIRICLVGFDTLGSQLASMKLQNMLQKSGFKIQKTDKLTFNDWIVFAPNSNDGVYIVNDFTANVYSLGRAKDNNIYTALGNPKDARRNCLQIDNKDTAILNYVYREPINNRPLNEVLNSLFRQAHLR